MGDQHISNVPKSVDNSRNACNLPHQFITIMREAVAELCGTFVLMVFGMGSVAQLVLSEGRTGSADQVRWAWGFGVSFGLYVSGGISGGHLNPALTLAFCVFKKTPWIKLVPYMIGQYLGSFIASCVVFVLYYDAFSTFKGGDLTLETAGVFATYPQSYLSLWNGLVDQIIATAVLTIVIMAVTDPSKMTPSNGYLPLIIGFVITLIAMSFSHNTGCPLNPARDLSPRLFTFMAGWGMQVFSVNDYKWFWIPIVGPHLGAILGAWIYLQLQQKAWPCSRLRIHCAPDTDTVQEEKNDTLEGILVENKRKGN